ncbi:vacuolar protein sorting-associated protein 33B-like isoform X2 [Acanthaster planci]|uniref:Vacuolar protein sorting-associated protein 33B-like isoform X2 n=1 Tax=Acanthaster planci TaxID=133434 RepID=A0A8B7ZT78_ACAPL|nr:vacuolar protein sorting-associated protein 33B-like isoform X2 [Acanthaster planci]
MAATSETMLPDFSVLKQLSKEHLVHLLESMPETKDLVIDPDLMRPLDRIAGAQLLKRHGVDKIFKLESNKLEISGDSRMYLVRSNVKNIKNIADQIKCDQKNGRKKKYKILFVPRKLYICEMLLEQEGVHGAVEMDDFKLDLIALDRDILSLEMPGFFRDYFVEGEHSLLHTIATSIVNLQSLFGTIPHIYGLGRCAKMVWDLVNTLKTLQGEPRAPIRNEIGHLFLIDREADLVTPLCTQTTYEGLLDETFSIRSGYCEFGPEVTGTDKSLRLLLNCEDQIFDDIRDRHISHVFGYLSSKAKMVQSGYQKGRELQNIGDVKSFVQTELKDLKQQYKSLTIHIGACERILNLKSKQINFEEQLQTEHSLLEGINMKECYTYIEEQIDRQVPPDKLLRLMCLLSLTQNGLPSKDYQTLQTHFLQSHGHKHLLTFSNLRKLGMYTEQPSVEVTKMTATDVRNKITDKALMKKTAFRMLCKKLTLIPKSGEVNLRSPEDMSYVFSGAFTPLTCRLVEQVLAKGGWAGLDDITKLLPVPTFAEHKAQSAKGHAGSGHQPVSPSEKVVLVYFLGGCTYAETAALRLLGKIKGYRFIFATTAITNGVTLIGSINDGKK